MNSPQDKPAVSRDADRVLGKRTMVTNDQALDSVGRVARRLAAPVLVAAVVAPFGLVAEAAQTQTRVDAFEYEPTSRTITKVLVEPDVSNLCVVVKHTLDSYGNKSDSTTRNCTGVAGANPPFNNESAAPAAGSLAVFSNRVEHASFLDPRFPDSSTDAAGQKIGLVHEGAFGTITALSDFNNHTTSSQVDGFGRKILESRPDGTGTQWSYRYCTNVAGGTETCPTVGDLAAVHVATSTPINSASGLQNGAATRNYFDASGKLVRSQTDGFDGQSATTVNIDFQYDAAGRIAHISRPYYVGATVYWTDIQYDALGRTVLVTTPDGGQTRTTFDGQTITVRDAMLHNTVTTLDASGQIAKVTDHLGHAATFTYTAFGEATTSTDNLGNVITQGRDLLGHVTALSDPDLGAESYGYNAVGEMVRRQNARGDVTTRAFDPVGRMTSSQTTNYQGNWYYGVYADGSPCANGIGQLCDMTGMNGFKEHYQYDGSSRVSSITDTIDKTFQTVFGYDATTGKLGSVQYPNGTKVNTSYTAKGFPIQLTDAVSGNSYWHADSVNADLGIAQETLGGIMVSQSGFDPTTGRLLTRSTAAASTLQSLSVGYDYVGNLTSRADLATGVFATYQYDELNRLLSETRQGGAVQDRRAYSNWFTVFVDDDLPVTLPGKVVVTPGQNIAWAYDSIGNIVSRSDVGGYSYAPSGANSVRPHAVSGITGTVNGIVNPAYAYDASGNLTSGAGRTATFSNVDDQPMPTQFTRGAATLNFWYAPNKGRIKETSLVSGALQRTTNYVHPTGYAGLLYEEDALAGGGVRQRSYLSVEGQVIGAILSDGTTRTTQYWLKDHLGSIDVLADASGNVVERLDYEPFGKRRSNGATDPAGTLASANSNRGFTGQEELDEVGLIHMNGRVYDPSIGRFVSADPYIPSPRNPQSYNRYAYVDNNPLSLTDPTGYAGDGSGSQTTGNAVDPGPNSPQGDARTNGNGDATGNGVDNIDARGQNTGLGADATTNARTTGDSAADEDDARRRAQATVGSSVVNSAAAGIVKKGDEAAAAAGPVAKEVGSFVLWSILTDGWSAVRAGWRGLVAKDALKAKSEAKSGSWFGRFFGKSESKAAGDVVGGCAKECSEIQKVEVTAPKPEPLRIAAPAKMHDHHLMPQKFREWFAQRGINIDLHTVTLGEKSHLKGLHGNGLGNMPGGWNEEWEAWINANPTASGKDVYQKLGAMMDEYNINHLAIHPYRK